MTPPQKPFPSYKWRWLSVTPSEGLLEAPVFLGVLRALKRHVGEPYTSAALLEDLSQVQQETRTGIDLVRTPERNLFRNSGQYWRGTGLVEPVSGKILLTDLGQRIALGQVTNDEFASLMIQNTVLPNPKTYAPSETAKWNEAGLRIKPLEIIVFLMDRLGRAFGMPEAYLTPNELIKVVVPLAGVKASIDSMAETIRNFRMGRLNLAGWPDCAPGANDKRLAREFLLFLYNFNVCRLENAGSHYDAKFILGEILDRPKDPDLEGTFLEDANRIESELRKVRQSHIPILIERMRTSVNILQRPGQARFRREVFRASGGRCLITDESTPDVVEAAHIIPVQHSGSDDIGNGICLRVDIHRLFDAGKIRINEDGVVKVQEQLRMTASYSSLPERVHFPPNVISDNVRWRDRYL